MSTRCAPNCRFHRFSSMPSTWMGRRSSTSRSRAGQTRRLLELEIARDAYVVYVRPELVVEIAFNEIQESPQYPGRLALRFARVKRYRPDKSAAEADTFATLQDIYRQTTGLEPP